MTKRIRSLLVIDTCDDCPHRIDYIDYIREPSKCWHPSSPGDDEFPDLPEGRIPRWCPLPRAPLPRERPSMPAKLAPAAGTETRPAGLRRRS